MLISAGTLFGVAKQAYSRAAAASPADREHVSNDPLVAIVFAAAAGEAFINELPDLASFPGPANFGPQPPEVASLVSLLGEAEDARASIHLKFLVAKLALSGHTYDRGSNPYQDFATLLELRNSLVHFQSERIDGREPEEVTVSSARILERLRAKSILVQTEDGGVAGLLYLVSTAAAARWACNATAGMIGDLFESIPSSWLQRNVNEFYYRNHAFEPVE